MADDIGKIGWIDMTVDNATDTRDFYATVVGLKPEDVDMGGYADFTMTMPASGEAVAGICHARGSNADLPAGWLIYFVVEDVEASAAVPVSQLAASCALSRGACQAGNFVSSRTRTGL